VHTAYPGRNSKQVEVMVAKHDNGLIAQCANTAQGTERVRPTVHEVAREPEFGPRLAIFTGTVINLLQQAIKRMTAALKVADDVNVGWVHRTSWHGSTGRYTSAAECPWAAQFLVSVLDSTVY